LEEKDYWFIYTQSRAKESSPWLIFHQSSCINWVDHTVAWSRYYYHHCLCFDLHLSNRCLEVGCLVCY